MRHDERWEVIQRLMRTQAEWREAVWQEFWVPPRTKHAAQVDGLCAEMQAHFSRGKR